MFNLISQTENDDDGMEYRDQLKRKAYVISMLL